MFADAMKDLRSAIEALRSEDLDHASDPDLQEGFAQVQAAWETLEAERLRRLAAVDRRRVYLTDGYLSTSTWVARTCRVAHGVAAGDLRVARALGDMPLTAEALARGDISASGARVLVGARETDPPAFAQAEAVLVEAARRHSVRDLHRVVAYWRSAAQSPPPGDQEGDDLARRRRLHVSPTAFGMVRIDGDLDPHTGETVICALRAFTDAEGRSPRPPDARTPAQARADALGEVCRWWLDRADRPAVGGERPHVTVTVDVEVLAGLPGLAQYDTGGPVPPESARLVACDAAVSRVLTMGRSEPLDVGRRTPVVPAAIRRAVTVRDRGCRFPGCDRPASWCDCHHVIHWAHGGCTAEGNLILLCRRHHRLVHHGFTVVMEDGTPVFRRPDGTVLEDPDPPWRSRGPTMAAVLDRPA